MKPSPIEIKESHAIYANVLNHLIQEGYADNEESAGIIVEGMSEEWYNSIIE